MTASLDRAVSGRTVPQTLNPAVEHGETGITVSYRPETNPIQYAEKRGASSCHLQRRLPGGPGGRYLVVVGRRQRRLQIQSLARL